MSRQCTLYTNLITVETNNRENLLEALKKLADFDCDFNGENGIEYAWEETIKNGFESNMEYLLNEVKDIQDDLQCVTEFVDTWMDMDSDYYTDYELKCLTDTEGNVTVISFSVLAGY